MDAPETKNEPLARFTLSSSLVTAVVDMIHEQGLEAGMKIGPQRELAARFGVALPTMREALRHLEGLGILSFQHGSGIYVGENFNRSVMPNAVRPRADRERLVELTQARVLIEPPIAEQAAAVREPRGIELLEQTLDDARQCLESGDERLWKVNIDLHRAIGATAGNRIIEEVLDSILLIHADDQRQILAIHGDPNADHAEHEEIVRLISAGRSEEVGEVVRRHLVDVVGAISHQET
ncbi:FadR family transcriptional regulator [Actinobacteria bacterium YIM 96077]|uniref:FadR family transcriptional regulator n=1 Tax=Phytoactinopolyspora halophila TaxID=1981511 RepID=A0A329QAI6_9ACTN|nr:FCD domain-containing protein [Phytoactinopolyspora halophila]AYY13722.1 FadR family transcriptional regulator [Actinobacteria bacterium YIM 96077]RAW09346.1 FadR family transcriptional regulator [Phytoactinopolyspora halophila]